MGSRSVWDCTDPCNCVPVKRSTREDPRHCSMDYAFFDYWATKLGWEDEDVIEMVAKGVERGPCGV